MTTSCVFIRIVKTTPNKLLIIGGLMNIRPLVKMLNEKLYLRTYSVSTYKQSVRILVKRKNKC